MLKRETHRVALVQGHQWQQQVLPGHRQRPTLHTSRNTPPAAQAASTAHAAMEMYAEAFDNAGALDKLEGLPASTAPTSTTCRATLAPSPCAASRGRRPKALCLARPTSSPCALAKRCRGAWCRAHRLGCALAAALAGAGRPAGGGAASARCASACRAFSRPAGAFCAPERSAEGQAYEQFIWDTRCVPTRDNLHDFSTAWCGWNFRRPSAHQRTAGPGDCARRRGRGARPAA